MYALQKLFAFNCLLGLACSDYWEDRDKLIQLEESRMVGASIVLNTNEKIANNILMSHKLWEYDEGFKDPRKFLASKHFFNARSDIKRSKVFNFIKKMPKGAALHGHDIALVSEMFLYQLTFKDNLYACTVNDNLLLRFMMHSNQDKTCNWTLVSILRQRDPNYDNWLRTQLTLTCNNPKDTYKDINQVWTKFQGIFGTVNAFINYRPVFEEYMYQSLKELYEDNVLYAEIRTVLNPVYELNGRTYTPVEIFGLYKKIIKRFTRDYPGFYGARIIYAPFRGVANTTLSNNLQILKNVSNAYPDIVAGFDLVGQEDLGHTLEEFVNQLLPISKQYNLFFHAGETNWYGTNTDFNLVDAILLGTKRIGHGYALTKHPQLLKIIKERQVAVEVCPISNQVLMLVDDLRNHPAASLIANGYPVVIGADDPSFWSAKGLSYDFYMTFMGLSSRNADLRLLKQLAINSIQYSALKRKDKQTLLSAWKKKWNAFINQTIAETDSANINNINVILT